jgi:hypothetical protein
LPSGLTTPAFIPANLKMLESGLDDVAKMEYVDDQFRSWN